MKSLVVITGASSGIGAAAARTFSQAGHSLLLIARRLDRMENLKLPNSLAKSVDVLDLAEFCKAVAEAEELYGSTDLLINNAGYMNLDHIAQQSPNEWKKQFEINCVGLLNCTSVIFPEMIKRKTGTIINVGSTAGRNIYDNHTAYNGTKYAVHAMSEGLRREGSPHNVRVIVVAPGMVDSELTSWTSNQQILADRESYRQSIDGALSSDDIARAMLFAYQQPQNLCIWELALAPTKQLT
ncbi:oxidoreductase [Actinomycetes bacterium]|nr:oxidoreductase [Actinomycetes bacterium]